MFQIKNVKLYFIFLLFHCAVYSASNCESVFHSKSKSGISNWLTHTDLLTAVENSAEINSSREYRLQYKDPTFNAKAISNWISFEQFTEFVKNSPEMNNPRMYRVRYRSSEPNLTRAAAQAGADGAKTAITFTRTAVKKMNERVERAANESLRQIVAKGGADKSNKAKDNQTNSEATENASLENNTLMENLKFAGKAMPAIAVDLGKAGAKAATSAGVNAVSNVGKKMADARANRVAARADRRAERAQAQAEAKEQKAQEKAERAQAEAKEQKAQEKAERAQAQAEATAEAEAKTDIKEQRADVRASRYETARQAFQNSEAVGRAVRSTVTGLLPESVVTAGKTAVAKLKQKRTDTAETETKTEEADKTAKQLKAPQAQEAQSTEIKLEILDQKISDVLNLGTRINKALANANIIDLKDLIQMSEVDLFKAPDIGKKSIEQIKEQLKEKGHSLKRYITPTKT